MYARPGETPREVAGTSPASSGRAARRLSVVSL